MTAKRTAEVSKVGLLASYFIPEAAHYLTVPPSTLRSWVVGRSYPTGEGPRDFLPPIEIADPKRRMLSFINLVEIHVLSAIRREHVVPLYRIRRAIDYLTKRFDSRHPLATYGFETDGLDLFVTEVGSLINASREGQMAMRELLSAHLRRIDWEKGVAARLYPFTRKEASDEPRVVVIDPRIAFGRPVLVGTGIPTGIIAERVKAGETIQDLAKDYGRDPSEIEEAVRCELHPQAA